jgi:Ca2+-binding EF-hand superfamily protein
MYHFGVVAKEQFIKEYIEDWDRDQNEPISFQEAQD